MNFHVASGGGVSTFFLISKHGCLRFISHQQLRSMEMGPQFDTDVNNKGADQTVSRGGFCHLLITLANRLDPDQGQQCRPKQFDTDVNNKERTHDCADSLLP